MATGNTTRKCPSKVKFGQKKCVSCKRKFIPNRLWQLYCSVRCRDWMKWKTMKSKNARVVRKGSVSAPFGTVTCPVCNDSFIATRPTQKYCSHRCFRLRIQRNWKNKNRAKGLCYSCTERPLKRTSSYCEKHWFLQAAWRAGLRGKGSWKRLKEILEIQNYTCPYTGRKLTPGINASVDHKKPRSLYRRSVGLIANLEWVDIEVNRAKRTLTKTKFIALCKLISSRFQ